ncbi:MAG TPA: hypothetical protein VJY64_02445 [Candidatus Onthovivens sp.]|nr:hypothetical protein [Candidatus Onthovivens sp.]
MKKIALSLVLVGLFSLCSCQPKEYKSQGIFYTLEKAFDDKAITQEDLINIAYKSNYGSFYHYNGDSIGDESSFYEIEPPVGVIKPIVPLDPQVALAITNDRLEILMEDVSFNNMSEEDKRIFFSRKVIGDYCGVYNGYYAIRFTNFKDGITVYAYKIINEVVFQYALDGSEPVVLWKKN